MPSRGKRKPRLGIKTNRGFFMYMDGTVCRECRTHISGDVVVTVRVFPQPPPQAWDLGAGILLLLMPAPFFIHITTLIQVFITSLKKLLHAFGHGNPDN